MVQQVPLSQELAERKRDSDCRNAPLDTLHQRKTLRALLASSPTQNWSIEVSRRETSALIPSNLIRAGEQTRIVPQLVELVFLP